MNSFKRYILMSVSSFALLLGALVPAVASADGNWQNCNWNNSCHTNTQGTLMVYVQTNNSYNTNWTRSPSDFTVVVSGTSSAQQVFPGSQNGNTLRLTGSYSVAIQNLMGYSPSYSVGCTGSLSNNETRTCVIILTNTNAYSPAPMYPPYQYQQPVTYVEKYVPALPNTGFEPTSKEALSFALALLLVVGGLFAPYVRKAFAAVLS